jgi:microcystin-dependent protein
MSSPYVGEIRMFGGNFAPLGWAFCAGQLLTISENETLFQLIGTTYGGDGQETFGLPDLQGRVPVHTDTPGPNYPMSSKVGAESVTLNTNQTPVHSHAMVASLNAGTTTNAANNLLSASPTNQLYTQDVASVATAAGNVGTRGNQQPHNNLQSYLAVSYIISLYGVFPSPT